MTAKHNNPSNDLIERLREIVKNLQHCQDYGSASFWADKVLYITNDADDAYERAKCLYEMKQYHRAAHTIKSRNFHQSSLACLYLAARCYYMGKDIKEASQLLDSPLITTSIEQIDNDSPVPQPSTSTGRQSTRLSSQQQSTSRHSRHKKDTSTSSPLSAGRSIKRWLGSIYLLKGKLYECSDNRQMAQACFKQALLHDIFCFEAFTSLTKHHMLTIEEESALINDLNIEGTFSDNNEMAQFVKLFYTLQGKKYHKPTESVIPRTLKYLHANVDVQTSLAERYYFNCDYYSAYELSAAILEEDLYHTECLPLYISSLMEIDKPTRLFDIAHKLVDLYPESPLAWFAVGCYYLVINKVEPARRYLSKATSIDSVFGPAWLVYGHSFAVEREHDQAMAAYFRAYHLMRGCHSPLLFIGVEYGRSGDCKLAEKFLSQAKNVAPEDPFVLHEYGVIHYRNKNFTAALDLFMEAEYILMSLNNSSRYNWNNNDKFKQKWEPLLNNMGHTLRRLERLDEAIAYHEKALSLYALNASTYSALGFLYYIKDDHVRALEYLNEALSIKYNDSIATSLLEKIVVKYNDDLKDGPNTTAK